MAFTITYSHSTLQDSVILNLDHNDFPYTCWLPNRVDLCGDEKITPITEQDSEHCNIRLEIYSEFVLASVHSHLDRDVIFQRRGNTEAFMIPVSTSEHQKSLILFDEDCLVTPEGRWSMRRATDQSQVVQVAQMADPECSPSQNNNLVFCPTESTSKYGREQQEHEAFSAQSNDLIQSSEPLKETSVNSIINFTSCKQRDAEIGCEADSLETISSPSEAHHQQRSETSSQASEAHDLKDEPKEMEDLTEHPTCREEEGNEADRCLSIIDDSTIEVVPRASLQNQRPAIPRKRKVSRGYGKTSTYNPKRRSRKNAPAISLGGDQGGETLLIGVRGIGTVLSTTRSVRSQSLTSPSSLDPLSPSPPLLSHPSETPERHTHAPPSSTLTPRLRKTTPCKQPCKELSVHPPIILFSTTSRIEAEKKIMRNFLVLGGTVAKSLTDATMLCVAAGPIKRTPKFVMAVSLGKDIVTDEWLVESQRQKKFCEPEKFLPQDPEHEREWGFNLREAIQRGKQGLVDILSNIVVQCTTHLKTRLEQKGQYREFGQIATVLGAEKVRWGWPPTKTHHQVIIIGVENDVIFHKAAKLGHRVYSQDLITMAALRGRLELGSEEFVLHARIKDEPED